MRSNLKWMAVCVLALALVIPALACGSSSGGGSTGSGPSLTLVNNSSSTVCYVYISPTTEDTWGDDQLGSTETISSGSQRVFNVSSGTYDLLAEDCDGNELATRWEVEISGPITWTLSD
jgi:hypothetical protein